MMPMKPKFIGTSVSIALNSDGSLDNVTLQKSSGYKDLDQEAIRTVRESAPFPNPPKELLSVDEKIYIPQWNFIITFGRGIF